MMAVNFGIFNMNLVLYLVQCCDSVFSIDILLGVGSLYLPGRWSLGDPQRRHQLPGQDSLVHLEKTSSSPCV
jgi:hypothetical protein